MTPKPSASPTAPPPKRQLMLNRAIGDAVPEAWVMNAGDTEKTYLIQGGKRHETITGPAAHNIRPLHA